MISLNIPSTIISIGNRATVDCYAIVDPSNPNYASEDGVLYDKGKTTLLSSPISKVGNFIIPSSVTSISDEAFMNCTGLTSINIPSNLSSMGSSAFCGCSGLKSINIPTGITYLGTNTFTGCSGLTTITIPSNISSIADSVFQWCRGLTSIYAYRPIPVHFPTSSDVFDGVSKYCIIYVPKGSIDAYWSASQWKDFVTIVEMTTALPTLKDEYVSLCPNLVNDGFHITGLTNTANLQLIDLNGRLVLSKQVINDESVSVASLAKGLYVVKLKTAEGAFQTKLIKK